MMGNFDFQDLTLTYFSQKPALIKKLLVLFKLANRMRTNGASKNRDWQGQNG